MATKVLLVDDDPNILSSYTRTLRKRFAFDTALGGEEGLRAIRGTGPYAVILSDMRMPGMDGIQFLAQARDLSPDSTRVMLTGNADQTTAIEAVNRGHIFKFLTKPCDPETLALSLELGIKQHLLITSEKELVEGTLKGCIDLLVDLLATTDPDAFARCQQLSPLAQKLARVMELPNPWTVMVASVLSQMGAVTLPAQVLARARRGDRLTAKEHEALVRLPEIGANLLRHIPRMEQVAQAILYMRKNFNGSGFPADAVRGEAIPLAARILRVASDYLELLPQRPHSRAVLDELRQKALFYDPRVINALELALALPDEVVRGEAGVPRPATHETVEIGDLLVDGVYTVDGLMVYPPQTRIGQSHLERLTNFARLVGLKEPFAVQV